MNGTNSWRRIIIILVAILVIIFVAFNYYDDRISKVKPTDFQSCLEAGNPVMESYPRRCQSGQDTFVEDIGNVLDKDQLIRVIEPKPNDIISSPVTIVGTARGTWFFEASFPVTLETASGTVVAVGVATALTDWMTEEFVPFKAELTFSSSFDGEASLILKKDNPSGLPEKDDSLVFPVIISSAKVSTTTPDVIVPIGGGCVISGCSSQICAEEEMMSTCEYNPIYACYKEPGVRCEKQENGQCGWTQTEALKSCLAGTE